MLLSHFPNRQPDTPSSSELLVYLHKPRIVQSRIHTHQTQPTANTK